MAADTGVRSAWDVSTGVLTVTLDRPSEGNALTWDMGRGIATALNDHAADARCVVLRSDGRAFCSGADLAMLRPLGRAGQEPVVRDHVYSAFQTMIRAIRACPVPVIARVHGPALGAGADLALACDIRVAADTAWLEESWIRLGVISALGGTHTLVQATGRGTAMDLLLTARRVTADEARSLGLWQRVVASDALDDELADVVGAIAGADPSAVRAMKRLLAEESGGPGLVTAMEHALDEQVPLIARDAFGVRVDAVIAQLRARSKGGS